MRNLSYKKGDIVEVDLGHQNKEGSEQFGRRPCIVISNDIGNKFAPILIVAPITKQVKSKIPTHVKLDSSEYGLVNGSKILTEQITTISKSRCRRFITTLHENDIQRVNKALAISLQMNLGEVI